MDNTLSFLKEKMSEVESPTVAENTTVDTQQNIAETTEVQTTTEQQTENIVEQPTQPLPTEESSKPKEETHETPKKVFANEQVAELNNFLSNNPEKTFADYQRLKVPTNEIAEDELLKEYFSAQGNKTEKEIALELKKLEIKKNGNSDDDFDFDEIDEEKNLEIEAIRERKLLEAREWREAEVNKQLTFTEPTTESNEPITEASNVETQSVADYQASLQKQQEDASKDYYTKTFQALNEITDVDMNISGERVGFTLDDASKKVLQSGLDVSTVLKKFYGENNLLNDANGFISELAWFIPELRDQMLSYRDEQVRVRTLNEQAKVRKNIQVENQVNVSGNNSTQERDAADAWLRQHYAQRV